MADSSIPLNTPTVVGQALDAESVGGLQRQRGQITGSALVEVSAVKNAPLAGTEYGLATRSADKSSAATVTKVAASAVDVTLLAANTARLAAIIYNDSTVSLFIKLGGAAGADDFTYELLSKGYYAVPAVWKGSIHGLWASATGAARVTEMT